MNRNYANGANWERRLKAELEDFGALVVMRSAGSHGVVDLAACFVGGAMWLQVKANGASVNRFEREALRRLGRGLSGGNLVGVITVSKGHRSLQVSEGGIPRGLVSVLGRMEKAGWNIPIGLTSGIPGGQIRVDEPPEEVERTERNAK